MALFKCGGGQQITYIYKDGKWNSKYPKYSTSSGGGEGTITYNSDGSFTWKGTERACMFFSNLPTDKMLCVKFVPITNVNWLHIRTTTSTFRQRLEDDYSNKTAYRLQGLQLTDPDNTNLYIGGNGYSGKIYEIFLI